MRKKKTDSRIYHVENYIQMKKVNCILRICFICEEVNRQAEKIKRHSTWWKQNWALEWLCVYPKHFG